MHYSIANTISRITEKISHAENFMQYYFAYAKKKNMCVYGHPTYPNFC